MNFNFSEVKETSNSNKWIGYGINDDTEIVSVESGEYNGTEYLDIKFKIAGDEDKNSTRIREFFSEKGTAFVQQKLLALHNSILKADMLKTKNFSSVDDMAAQLNAMWKGRKLRLKLAGKEYEGVDADGAPKVKVSLSIPLYGAFEATMPGAEHEPVSKENSKLTFTKEGKYKVDQWDWEPLLSESDNNDKPKEDKGGNDLPF